MKIEKWQAMSILSAILLLTVIVIGVNAFNAGGTGGNPAVAGHSVDEIDWSKAILSNVIFSGNISFNIGDILEFGANDPAKVTGVDHVSGTIDYKRWSAGLDIVGASRPGSTRLVTVWDDICTGGGKCLSTAGGGTVTRDLNWHVASQSCDQICGVGKTIFAYARNPDGSTMEISSDWSNAGLWGRCICLV